MTENDGTPEEKPAPGYWEQQAAGPPPVYSQWSYGQPTDPNQPGQNPYGQPPYPPPPYQPYTQYASQDHPKATTALVLGLVGVVGGMMCGLPLLVSPFAWATGVKARREIRQANGQLGGDGSATAGMVLGIIGSVLLALALIVIVVLVILAVNDPSAFDDSSNV